MPQTIEAPVKPLVEPEVVTGISTSTLNDSYVYVHCHFNNRVSDMLIRIWRSTFLVDRNSGGRSKMIHSENISIAPVWTILPKGEFSFLLIFEALSKDCVVFDFVEDIPQEGGFFVPSISRNATDVYHITI
jgi:hypothetical protein